MLTSPQTITIDGVDHSLSRINQDSFGSVYLKKATNAEYRLVIRHSYEKASATGQYERHNAELTVTTWDVDGKQTVVQSYAVIRKLRGTADDTSVDVNAGLNNWLNTNGTAIVGWES